MLTIIVIYLLYSSRVDGEYSGNPCFEPNFNCLRHNDCCSNNCRKFGEEAFGICTLKANDNLTVASLVKKSTCLKSAHICIKNDDCCSKNCKKVGEKDDLGICNSKADDDVTSSFIVDKNLCFKAAHVCMENDDCCSENCINVKSHFHVLLRACGAKHQKSD